MRCFFDAEAEGKVQVDVAEEDEESGEEGVRNWRPKRCSHSGPER